MKTNDMSIEPAGLDGTYRVGSRFDGESIAITAQGLLELADWINEHRAQLEAEAVEGNEASIRARFGR